MFQTATLLAGSLTHESSGGEGSFSFSIGPAIISISVLLHFALKMLEKKQMECWVSMLRSLAKLQHLLLSQHKPYSQTFAFYFSEKTKVTGE
ncbi:hypothetical protein N9E62_03235 [Salibacteraceae bacterium]|jgi:hypothetical protein|nr:hypothetical protein [Salibacteraceae bacterium]